ncbi:hypothetical protein GCM10010304_76260 [Streptomyces roseoviolaceus]
MAYPVKHNIGTMIFEAHAKWLRIAAEPTVPAAAYHLSDIRRQIALSAARVPAGLERGGDRSAGPAGGRAARGERSELP